MTDSAPEGCKLVAYWDADAWILEVMDRDNEIVAYLDYEKIFGKRKMKATQLEKLGFEIIN